MQQAGLPSSLEGPPVLFIQGINVHGYGWTPQVDRLQDRFACLTFDHRGMGGSELGSTPITVARMAKDAAAVMDAAGWGSAQVVWHSLGGPVGLHLALKVRRRVRSLALLSSFATGRGVGPLGRERRSGSDRAAVSRSRVGSRHSGARYVELAGSSHGVVLTEADRVNELLAEHLTHAQ